MMVDGLKRDLSTVSFIVEALDGLPDHLMMVDGLKLMPGSRTY